MANTSDMDIKPITQQSPPIDLSQPYDASTLSSKAILITGAANGLGEHMVRKWASHGADIFIGDIDDSAGEALVADLRAKYPSATFSYTHCDVTRWEDQVSLFDEAVRSSPHGAIDIVVPNAGIITTSDSITFEHPELVNGVLPKPNTKTIDVNITGATYTTHLALYHLSRNPRPDRCILLLGSMASILPFAGQAQYTMSKHAMMGLFRCLRMTAFTLAQETGVKGHLRVNLIAPYFVRGSRMLPRAVDAALLVGGAGAASIEDVVDTATRLVADETIVGRALVVGPRMKGVVVDGVEPAVADCEGGGEGRGAREVYGFDGDEVDVFTWRYIRLMNQVARAKGVVNWLVDLWRALTGR